MEGAFQQRASNSRQSILRPSGTDTRRRKGRHAHRHAHTHRHTHTHTHDRGEHSMTQLENVLGSTIQGKSNQIKLAECYIRQGCCCWQTAAGCRCVLLSQWQGFLRSAVVLLVCSGECYLWSCIRPMIMRAECCRNLWSGSVLLQHLCFQVPLQTEHRLTSTPLGTFHTLSVYNCTKV